MAVGKNTYKESEGRSVNVTLEAVVEGSQVAYVEGWLGVAGEYGEYGDMVALRVDRQEYQFEVPSGLSVSKGDIVRIDTTQVTGHTPDDGAYNKDAASATNIDLFRATSDKDANHVVTGILLSGM